MYLFNHLKKYFKVILCVKPVCSVCERYLARHIIYEVQLSAIILCVAVSICASLHYNNKVNI